MADTLSVTDMLPTKFEPLKRHRFVFAIEGVDSFIVKTAARPQMEFEENEIPWINSKRWVAGKGTWQTMNVTLHDPIAPSGAQQVMEWVRLCFESVSGRAGYADFYKRDIQIKMLDPVGTVVQLWDIKGAWVKSMNFNELGYESNDMADVTLSIRFDNCVLQY